MAKKYCRWKGVFQKCFFYGYAAAIAADAPRHPVFVLQCVAVLCGVLRGVGYLNMQRQLPLAHPAHPVFVLQCVVVCFIMS